MNIEHTFKRIVKQCHALDEEASLIGADPCRSYAHWNIKSTSTLISIIARNPSRLQHVYIGKDSLFAWFGMERGERHERTYLTLSSKID